MDDFKASPCQTCGKDDFYPVGLSATTGLLFILLGFLKSVMVQTRVCLACGTITSAVEAKALYAIRAIRAKRDTKAAGR